MNLNFFGDSSGENLNFDEGINPETADKVRQYITRFNEKCRPYILRALLAARPIHDLSQPEALPGDIFDLSHGDIGRYPKWMPRNASIREGFTTLEIPRSVIDALETATAMTSGVTPLEHVLMDVCEIPPADFLIGTIINTDGKRNKAIGLSVLIKEDNYRALAQEVLELLANPRTGCQLCGCTNGETYQYAHKDSESDPSKIIARMYEASGFMRKEMKEIRQSAISHNNFEFVTLMEWIDY